MKKVISKKNTKKDRFKLVNKIASEFMFKDWLKRLKDGSLQKK